MDILALPVLLLSANPSISEYCHNVTAVEPKWLVEVAPQFFKVADANKISKRKRQEKIEPLFNKVWSYSDDERLPYTHAPISV